MVEAVLDMLAQDATLVPKARIAGHAQAIVGTNYVIVHPSSVARPDIGQDEPDKLPQRLDIMPIDITHDPKQDFPPVQNFLPPR